MINGWESLAESLTAAFGDDFVEDFIRTLQDEQRVQEEMAFSQQRRIAAATERLEECWLNGLGECHMRLDPEIFFHWVKKEGRQCWNDKGFIREFKRDNKEVIVKSKAPRLTVLRP